MNANVILSEPATNFLHLRTAWQWVPSQDLATVQANVVTSDKNFVTFKCTMNPDPSIIFPRAGETILVTAFLNSESGPAGPTVVIKRKYQQ